MAPPVTTSVGAIGRDQVALGRTDDHAGRGIVAAGRLAADDIPRRHLSSQESRSSHSLAATVPVTSVPMLFIAIVLPLAP